MLSDPKTLYTQAGEIKKDFNTFQNSPEMKEYHQNMLAWERGAINTIQNLTEKIQYLINHALEYRFPNTPSFNQYIQQQRAALDIPIELATLFKAWYSTNVDRELVQDLEAIKNSDFTMESVTIFFKDIKNLFADPVRTKINTILWTIQITPKDIPQKPIRKEKQRMLPMNTIGIGEINKKEYYKESESICDQIAYHFYEKSGEDEKSFIWLWDHHRYRWINGLSIALYFLLENYIQGKNTYTQHISFFSDIHKPEIIDTFNKIFDWYLSVELSQKPHALIYKVLK